MSPVLMSIKCSECGQWQASMDAWWTHLETCPDPHGRLAHLVAKDAARRTAAEHG